MPQSSETISIGARSVKVDVFAAEGRVGLRIDGCPENPFTYKMADDGCQLFLNEILPLKLGLTPDEGLELQKALLRLELQGRLNQGITDEESRGWETDAEKYTNVKKVRDEISGTLLQNSREMTEREKYESVSRMAYKHLYATGRFYFDELKFEGYWFDSSTKILHKLPAPRLREAEKTQAFLANRFAVNQEDRAFRWIVSGIHSRVTQRALRVSPRVFAFFGKPRRTLYINHKPGRMLKLDGEEVKEVDNGEDGVVFLWNDRWEPWDFEAAEAETSLWKSLVYSKFSIERTAEGEALTLDELSALLDVYVQAILFRSIVPHRPILAHIGPFGSGKTLSAMLVGMVLFGPSFQVIGLEEQKQDSIIAYVTNNVFGVLDNADEKIKWLPDVLARVATGQSIPKRKLYTTNELVLYDADILLAITARVTPWARPDVVSRLIPLYFQQPRAFRSEERMREEVLSNRQKLMAELVSRANACLRVLAKNSEETESPTRLAGFFDFGVKVSESPVLFRSAFGKVVVAQNVLTYEEQETLIQLLKEWIQANLPKEASPLDGQRIPAWTTPMAATDVFGELSSLARERGLRLEVRTANGLGMVLRNIAATLSDLGIVFKVTRRSRANLWSFSLADSGSGGP